MEEKQSNLATEKKVCPFPEQCNERFTCVKDHCNYDTCVNGYSFRQS